jgi:hypothetical protein
LEEQRATFAAANANLDSFVTVDAPRRGAPIRYRFRRSTGAPNWDGFPGAAGFEGKTLHEVMNRNLKPTTGLFQSGLAYIKWVCGSNFNWNSNLFPKHVLLYHELVFLQSEGISCYDGQGHWTVSVPVSATRAYEQ